MKNSESLIHFKKRFEALEKFEKSEARKASLKDKFQQLNSLFSLAIELRINLNKNKPKTVSNWTLLKT